MPTSALTIHRLDAQAMRPFLLLMQPGERRRIWEERGSPAQIVLGASLLGQPAGVAVGVVSGASAALTDLYVLPAYRRGGIGGALLAELEAALVQAGAERIETLYRPNEQSPGFEAILRKQGWQLPNLSHIVFWTTRVLDGLTLDWVQQYRFEPPYEVVPWPHVTEADLQFIARLGEEGRYSPDLSLAVRPFEAWDAETSFVLRHEDTVAGWVCAVREAPLQLLVDILFVYPPRQRLGKMLIGEVIRRCLQIGMTDIYWRVKPNNEPMLQWSRRSLPDTITDEFEEWYSLKVFG
jgi:GNAT superfamily N-acetyltransferase